MKVDDDYDDDDGAGCCGGDYELVEVEDVVGDDIMYVVVVDADADDCDEEIDYHL